MKEHLASYRERNGKDHPMLADAPVFPAGLELLWSQFLDLHVSRGSTGFGPARITFVDIDAWQRVTGSRLEAWEIGAIRKADDAYMRTVSAEKSNDD